MLGNLEKLLKQVDNRARFLSGVLSGDIKCINRKKNELRQEFMAMGFDPLPKEVRVRPVVVIGATGDQEQTEERPGVGASDYDYLTSMSVASLDEEYLHHLLELKRRLEIKVGLLRKAAPICLKTVKKPTLLGRTYKKRQSDRDVMAAKDSQVSEAAPRRQRKRTAAESLEASAMLMDDDEEEAPDLEDQSQEHTETDCSQKQERMKQSNRRRKKRRKESRETGAPKHCRRALDFRGHDKSGDGFLIKEIKKIASGLDGIVITHRNTDQSMVAHELGKLSLRDSSVPLCHKGVV